MIELQPHQQRVLDERKELVTKMESLGAFLKTEIFKDLDRAEKRRLSRQMTVMSLYADVLEERMEAFGVSPFTN